MFRSLAAACLPIFLAGAAMADTLNLASWNVANLAEKPGVALRGHERTDAEFQKIRDIIADIDPDIIALQEMGSIASAKAILSDQYTIAFEDRCAANAQACKHDVEDIFTAIAYKKSLGNLKIVQAPELAVQHPGNCPGDPSRPVRGGVGVEFQQDGKSYVMLSVHLKASCKDNPSESRPDQVDDCATQAKQIDILIEWIRARKAEGKEVIVAGDFNRELLNPGDHIASKFTAFDPNVKFLPTVRECWKNFNFPFNKIKQAANAKFPEIVSNGGQPVPFGPKSNAEIDYFLISGASSSSALQGFQFPSGDQAKISEMATDYIKACDGKPSKFENGGVLTFSEVEPSDHCPITMELQ